LANPAGILSFIFGKKQMKARKDRLDTLVSGELIGEAVLESIYAAIQAAVTASTTATVVH
jgi:hypothetical protein